MSEFTDGGLAFPRISAIEAPNTIGHMQPKYSEVRSTDGMSLRDYFAGQAIASIASPDLEAGFMARFAYAIADAMLKAREAQP